MSNNIRRKLEWRTSRVARLSVVLVACALFSAIVGCGIRIQPPATKIQLTQKRAAEIHAEFDAFIASVAAEDYRRLRSTIVALPGYNPYSTDLETIEALVENGSRDEAKDLLESVLSKSAVESTGSSVGIANSPRGRRRGISCDRRIVRGNLLGRYLAIGGW